MIAQAPLAESIVVPSFARSAPADADCCSALPSTMCALESARSAPWSGRPVRLPSAAVIVPDRSRDVHGCAQGRRFWFDIERFFHRLEHTPHASAPAALATPVAAVGLDLVRPESVVALGPGGSRPSRWQVFSATVRFVPGALQFQPLDPQSQKPGPHSLLEPAAKGAQEWVTP